MKTAKTKFFIVALAVMMFPAFALAQYMPLPLEDAYIAPLSIRLVETSNVPGVIARNDNGTTETPRHHVYGDEWTTRGIDNEAMSAKLTRTRITNQTILAMLMEAQAIPAVRGSQLALLVSSCGFDVVVIRRGSEPIFVNGYLGVNYANPIVQLYKYDYRATKERFSEQERSTYKGIAGVYVNMEPLTLIAEGVFEMSMSSSENNVRDLERFLGGKITSIAGESESNNECWVFGCRNLVEGSITIGQGRFYSDECDDDDDDDDVIPK